ncbi:MAG: CoA pyrophosphatase [Paracoccaceae bacterium]|jgi:8-oxo-dGTP pyrophosphatase MutT (NUDIX family)
MPDRFAPVLRALRVSGRPTSDYDLNKDQTLAEDRLMRPAAVLVGFQESTFGLRLLLTKRASHLKHHPGQIAFPGGKIDQVDRDAVSAALREAEEEIGLQANAVDVLGTLDAHETVTGFSVTPVLAKIDPYFRPTRQEEEVEEAFTVPFEHIADPKNYRIEGRIWRGEMRRYYTVPYGPYYIWGATARMLRALADRMG